MSGIIVCYSTCWSCKFDYHFEPAEWHSWADDEDIAHAKATSQPDPSKQKCACPCAGVGEKP